MKLIAPLLILILLVSCESKVKEGYTDKVSYSNGETVNVFLSSDKKYSNGSIDIYNLDGTFKETLYADLKPQKPGDKAYENGANFEKTLSFKLSGYVSGIYMIENIIPFIVKPEKPRKITILYSSNTENAYGNYGGKSAYGYNSSNKKPAEIVSFQRPMKLSHHSDRFLEWICTKNYDIGYVSDMDMDDYANIEGTELLIIPGHSEYWTRKARRNFDRFIDAGGNALILSGNTMWWQVRYTDDLSKMIIYRDETKDSNAPDSLKTILWNNNMLDYPIINSIGVDFDFGGFGRKEDKGWDGYKIVNDQSPLLKGTNLKNGDIIKLPSDEMDGADLNVNGLNTTMNNNHGFYKYELIGYDLGYRKPHSNLAWIVLQKSETSGIIINTASTDWCDEEGMEEVDSDKIKQITLNCINLLLSGKNVFTE